MRMEHFQSMQGKSKLNLVSLMDIFTILVFFLLVNSSSQQLPNSKDVKLPASVAEKVPAENLVIAVTSKEILVAGRSVASLQDVLSNDSTVIPSLTKELQYQASNILFAQLADKNKGHSVTILGDEKIPYEIMSKILASCQKANYTKIAFAALQKAKRKS